MLLIAVAVGVSAQKKTGPVLVNSYTHNYLTAHVAWVGWLGQVAH